MKGDDKLKIFQEIEKEWLIYKSLNVKRSTLVKYENLLNHHILPVFSNRCINEIDDTLVSQFLYDKKQTLSLSVIKTCYYLLQAILEYGSRKYNISLKYYKVILPNEKKSVKTLTKVQQKTLEEIAINSSKEIAPAIFLGLYAGLRIGEICALKWQDIDLKRKTIIVCRTVQRIKSCDKKKTELLIGDTKTQSSHRMIPICKDLFEYLKGLRPNKIDNRYVLNNKDQIIDPKKIQNQLKRLLKQCYLDNHIHFHMLRHTFATNCVEKGMDIKSLSEILGHSNVNITLNTYVHSSFQFKLDQMNKINHFLVDVVE